MNPFICSPSKPFEPRGPAADVGDEMNDCRRNLTKDELIAGLKAGRTLCVDRRDAPELLELEAQGLVESRLVEIDEQSSVLTFRWKE
jgi:hypothetical protein